MQKLELLGNGASAKVYRICPPDNGAETMLFDYNEINKITLFHQGEGPPHIISGIEKENIKELSMALSPAYNYIWKVFKSSEALGTAENLLKDEIEITKKINGIYGGFAGKFLTTGPIKGYKNLLIIGMSIEFKNPEETKHVLFNNYCNNNYWKDTIDIINFCKDILESLVILNNKGYRHGDIKLDNIVKCGDKFKLIDWGLCHALDKYMLKGDFASTSPIKYRMLSRGDDGYSDAGRFPGHIFRHEQLGLYDHTDPSSYGPIPGELSFKKKVYGAESIENEVNQLEQLELTGEISDALKYYKTNPTRVNPYYMSDPPYTGRAHVPIHRDERKKIVTAAYKPQLYLETLRRRQEEYDSIAKAPINDLKTKFRETLDVYMLGMTVLSLVVPGRTLLDIAGFESERWYEKNLGLAKIPIGAVSSRPPIIADMRFATKEEQPETAKEIVRKFTSLTNPLTPEKALEYINSIRGPVLSVFNDDGLARPKAPITFNTFAKQVAERTRRARERNSYHDLVQNDMDRLGRKVMANVATREKARENAKAAAKALRKQAKHGGFFTAKKLIGGSNKKTLRRLTYPDKGGEL